jgi:hypothetical protein
MNKDTIIQIGPRVDRLTYKNFKILCAIKGTSIKSRIEQLMREDIKKSKQKT